MTHDTTHNDPIIQRLLEGHRGFYERYLDSSFAEYRNEASQGQSPHTMIISCSDSRVSPSIITNSGLGELFQVRNVANLVPPYESDQSTHHGTSAALEFAVLSLQVQHIILLGHSSCGGIRALIEEAQTILSPEVECSFILPWMDIVRPAKEKTASLPPEKRQRACEEEAIKISLTNLLSFPWIATRVQQGTLALHGWHFDIPSGELTLYDRTQDRFISAHLSLEKPLKP